MSIPSAKEMKELTKKAHGQCMETEVARLKKAIAVCIKRSLTGRAEFRYENIQYIKDAMSIIVPELILLGYTIEQCEDKQDYLKDPEFCYITICWDK